MTKNNYNTEELVAKIKAGDAGCYVELWHEVEKFVKMRAEQFADLVERPDDVEDMLQEAYLILPDAIDYYDEKRGKAFLGVLCDYYLPRAFNKAVYGGRSVSNYKEPMNNYVSFETPITNDGEENLTIIDILTDEQSRAQFDYIEDADYWRSINNYLREGISNLKRPQERKLMQYMLDHDCGYGQAFKNRAIGQLSHQRYRDVFNKASRNLRIWINGRGKKDAIKSGIIFYGTHQYYAGGLTAFKEHNFTSNVEMIILRNEERGKYK